MHPPTAVIFVDVGLVHTGLIIANKVMVFVEPGETDIQQANRLRISICDDLNMRTDASILFKPSDLFFKIHVSLNPNHLIKMSNNSPRYIGENYA